MVTIEFLITSLIVVLIPGTGVLYTIATGLFVGKRASLFAAIGCTLGIVPALLASTLGLAAIFHTSAIAFQFVKYVGVAYLLYLAWAMWQSSTPLSVSQQHRNNDYAKIALRGFLINILNPKLSIFFLAFLPQFITSTIVSPLVNMLILGFIFMLMTLTIFIVYGLSASLFSEFLVGSKKLSVVIQKIFAGTFASLGIKLALSDRV